MTSALIIYGSLTGNTEECAEIIASELRKNDVDVTIFEAMEADPEDLLDYDILVIGSYTYGSDAEIPDEMLDYYDAIEDMDLSGKVFGTFGSGDDFYPKFATAVDDFEDQFLKAGAIRVGDNCKINLAPDEPEDIENLKRYANQMVSYFNDANQ